MTFQRFTRATLIRVLIELDCRLRTVRGSSTISIMMRAFKESRALIVKLLSEHEVSNFQARATVRVAVQKPSDAQVPPALANLRASECTRHINCDYSVAI